MKIPITNLTKTRISTHKSICNFELPIKHLLRRWDRLENISLYDFISTDDISLFEKDLYSLASIPLTEILWNHYFDFVSTATPMNHYGSSAASVISDTPFTTIIFFLSNAFQNHNFDFLILLAVALICEIQPLMCIL